MIYSNFVEEPAVVKSGASRAAWRTRRVKDLLGAHVSVSTSAFSTQTLVEGGTGEDLKTLAEALPDALVERSNHRFITVLWQTCSSP